MPPDGIVDERPEDVRLVDVSVPAFAQVLERVDICRDLFHARYYTTITARR